MALTGRQIRQLRSLAHHLEAVVIVGKSNVTENTVEQASEYLEKHDVLARHRRPLPLHPAVRGLISRCTVFFSLLPTLPNKTGRAFFKARP